MEKYSHDAFDISGYIVRVPSLGSERNIVLAAWEKFQSEKIGDLITDKAHESLQAVYFNYTNPGEKNMGYDMLIGYMTAEGTNQLSDMITTLHIPAQDYQYITLTENIPNSIGEAWIHIRNMTESELPRTYGYDMDMYSADGKSVTVAVAVKSA